MWGYRVRRLETARYRIVRGRRWVGLVGWENTAVFRYFEPQGAPRKSVAPDTWSFYKLYISFLLKSTLKKTNSAFLRCYCQLPIQFTFSMISHGWYDIKAGSKRPETILRSRKQLLFPAIASTDNFCCVLWNIYLPNLTIHWLRIGFPWFDPNRHWSGLDLRLVWKWAIGLCSSLIGSYECCWWPSALIHLFP